VNGEWALARSHTSRQLEVSSRLIINTNRVVCLRVSNGSVRVGSETELSSQLDLAHSLPANVSTHTRMQPGEHQSFQRHIIRPCCRSATTPDCLFRVLIIAPLVGPITSTEQHYATSVLINYFCHQWILHALLGRLVLHTFSCYSPHSSPLVQLLTWGDSHSRPSELHPHASHL
jgi:hypothetical protein